jgi:hypothetical protein
MYRIRQGKVLVHEGVERYEGDLVELTPEQAIDHAIVDKVEAVNTLGDPVRPPEALDAELAAARAHEHVSILTAERDALKGRLERVEAALARLEGETE